MALKCSHRFHRACVLALQRRNVAHVCPLCEETPPPPVRCPLASFLHPTATSSHFHASPIHTTPPYAVPHTPQPAPRTSQPVPRTRTRQAWTDPLRRFVKMECLEAQGRVSATDDPQREELGQIRVELKLQLDLAVEGGDAKAAETRSALTEVFAELA